MIGRDVMTAEIVNLNKFRKARMREDKDQHAEENRAKFGRTLEQKTADAEERRRRDQLLDGSRRILNPEHDDDTDRDA